MDKRDEYVEKLKAQLDTWNAEMAKWQAKAAAAQADAKVEYEKQVAEFRRQRDQGLEQMRRIQDASGNAWVELVRGADEAWAKMRESFERAGSHFKK